MNRSLLLCPFATALLVGLTACAEVPLAADPVRFGPVYTPRNHAGDAVLPVTLRRVVVLPLSAGELAPPETVAVLEETLLAALQKQARFEVVTLPRDESRRLFGRGDFPSVGALPPGYLTRIGERFAADAVLFVDLTAFRAYRPLAIGFRAKLAMVQDVRLAWTFDEVVSAEDPAVANGARRHYLGADRSGQPLDLSPTVLQNPTRFAAYVAETMFQTLPPR